MNLAEIYKNNDKHTINMRNMTAMTLKIFQYILCKKCDVCHSKLFHVRKYIINISRHFIVFISTRNPSHVPDKDGSFLTTLKFEVG